MDFDFTALPDNDLYRLLTNFVGPRPIALVSTANEDGSPNAAPMSFFNVFSHEPPILIIGVQPRPDGTPKDTVANLRRTGEFIVHMVDMSIAQAMLVTGRDYPPGTDEIALAGLSTAPARQVGAPRIAEAPWNAGSSRSSTTRAAPSSLVVWCRCSCRTAVWMPMAAMSTRRSISPSPGCTPTITSPATGSSFWKTCPSGNSRYRSSSQPSG